MLCAAVSIVNAAELVAVHPPGGKDERWLSPSCELTRSTRFLLIYPSFDPFSSFFFLGNLSLRLVAYQDGLDPHCGPRGCYFFVV